MTRPPDSNRKARVQSSGRISSARSADLKGVTLSRVDALGNLYTPNHIPATERVWNTILSLALVGYGTFGVLIDDIFLPGKRSRGMHFHGTAAWLLYAAMLCAAANLLSVVVDHCDSRNNETNYKQFARATQVIAWVLFGVALVLNLLMSKRP
jgi:hypothetical protein